MWRFYRSGVIRTNYIMPSCETWTQHRWHHLSQHESHELITQQTTAWQLHSSMVLTEMDVLVDWRWFYSMITVQSVALWLPRSKIGTTTYPAIGIIGVFVPIQSKQLIWAVAMDFNTINVKYNGSLLAPLCHGCHVVHRMCSESSALGTRVTWAARIWTPTMLHHHFYACNSPRRRQMASMVLVWSIMSHWTQLFAIFAVLDS